MEVGYECCCGLAVHAKTVVACLITKGRREIRTFTTMTDELLELGDWLRHAGCTHGALESTGVYWKPGFNMLEGLLTVILVNARHLNAVPGRKTDVRDCEWLADLLRHGLLKASFMPPVEIRELRELVRYRQTVVTEHTAVATRITKLIESAHIKLGQVASEVLGLSGRLMLRALAAGEHNPDTLAEVAQGKLKSKKAELRRAVEGRLPSVQRWVLAEFLTRVEELEAALTRVETRIGEEVAACPEPFVPEAVALLESIPGVGIRTAQTIVAEIGVDMGRFPSAKHLASWAGVCPGNHESAGKRKSGQPTKGNKSVRTILGEAAWAATHAKGTFLQAKYQRVVRRMPKQKALGAIAHRLLVISYHLLSRRVPYAELGTVPPDQQQVTRQRRRLVEQLATLGMKVTVEETAVAL
jgi:transposase